MVKRDAEISVLKDHLAEAERNLYCCQGERKGSSQPFWDQDCQQQDSKDSFHSVPQAVFSSQMTLHEIIPFWDEKDKFPSCWCQVRS